MTFPLGHQHQWTYRGQVLPTDARVTVQEVPGKPGTYDAVAWMRPWLQMEELTTSLRMVARIPEKQ